MEILKQSKTPGLSKLPSTTLPISGKYKTPSNPHSNSEAEEDKRPSSEKERRCSETNEGA
jgi:hypothetical protein